MGAWVSGFLVFPFTVSYRVMAFCSSLYNYIAFYGYMVASGTIDGAAPIKFCSFFLTLIEEKGTINVLGSIETHIKIV